MIARLLVVASLLTFYPLSVSAQQNSNSDSLTDKQKEGRRIFQQRCAVCHTIPTITSKRYGPFLNKDIVEGNEDQIRGFIMNGFPGEMPGFKYGLERSEIDDIIEYLKTVPDTPQPKPKGPEGK